MAERVFDRETILDLAVNIIPLGIVLFFVLLFALQNPFGWDPLVSSLQFGLLILAFVLLAVLTYISGKAIAGDEKRHEGEIDPGRAGLPNRGVDTDGAPAIESEATNDTATVDGDREDDPAVGGELEGATGENEHEHEDEGEGEGETVGAEDTA
jgi:hypothetical protein